MNTNVKRVLRASSLVAVMIAADAAAGPTSATGGGKYRDGEGPRVTLGFVGIDAAGPSGDKGRFTYRDSSKQFANVQIDCVRVEGDRTFLSGFVMVSNFASRWTPFLAVVFDRGEPERDSVFADFFAYATCETVQETSINDLLDGNIQVRDRNSQY